MTRHSVAMLHVFSPAYREAVETEVPEQFEPRFIKTTDEQEKLDAVAGVDFILAGATPVSARHMEAAPRLRLIQKWGIGYEKIDVKAAAARGIPVAITAGVNAGPVAEHAVLLMLAVYRKLPILDRIVRQGGWNSAIPGALRTLEGKTVGVIGFGHIGREVAKRVRAFNASVIYYDVLRADPRTEAELGVTFRMLPELFTQADIITVHTPLTATTRDLVDATAFSLMKPTAVVINTSRGGTVNESALIEALTRGRIMAAGLDVFAVEPVDAANPLLTMDNVVLTPHWAGGVIENARKQTRHAFANMLKVVKGEPLPEADVISA